MSLISLAVMSLNSNAQMEAIVSILQKSAMHTVQRCIVKGVIFGGSSSVYSVLGKVSAGMMIGPPKCAL